MEQENCQESPPKTSANVRVALYLRISTRADKRDGEDAGRRRQETDDQLRLLREFCAGHGWSIVIESAAGGEKRIPTGKPIGRPRLNISPDQVVALRKEGLSWRQIGQKFDASIAAVRRAYKEALANTAGESSLCRQRDSSHV